VKPANPHVTIHVRPVAKFVRPRASRVVKPAKIAKGAARWAAKARAKYVKSAKAHVRSVAKRVVKDVSVVKPAARLVVKRAVKDVSVVKPAARHRVRLAKQPVRHTARQLAKQVATNVNRVMDVNRVNRVTPTVIAKIRLAARSWKTDGRPVIR
jgi:hypothetical protein